MVKLDLILLPFVLLLRVSLLVMSLSFIILKHIKLSFCVIIKSTQYPYDYFFHPFNNERLRAELTNTVIWLWYVALSVLLSLIYWMYRLAQFSYQWTRLIWMSIAFWPKLYLYLLGPSSAGRSILKILADPTNVGQPRNFNVHRSNRAMSDLLTAATTTNFKPFEPLLFEVPYEYIALRIPEPPDCYSANWSRELRSN